MLQRGYGIGSIFISVASNVMPSLKEIGKSALTTGLGILQDVAKDENIKTAAKKRLKENSLAFLDDTVSRIAPRKSIKGSTNKQIAISSLKPIRNVNIILESLTTLYFQSRREKETENGQTCSQRF